MPKWTDKPWERQHGESTQAYEAFVAYRDMETKRSLRAVGQQLGKSKTLIERWNKAWNWQERVRAYENELDKMFREKAIKERKKMIVRHIDIAMQLQRAALTALKDLNVEKMSVEEIRQYLKMATDLERLSRTDEENNKTESNSSNTLADTILTAWQKRKDEGNF